MQKMCVIHTSSVKRPLSHRVLTPGLHSRPMLWLATVPRAEAERDRRARHGGGRRPNACAIAPSSARYARKSFPDFFFQLIGRQKEQLGRWWSLCVRCRALLRTRTAVRGRLRGYAGRFMVVFVQSYPARYRKKHTLPICKTFPPTQRCETHLSG